MNHSHQNNALMNVSATASTRATALVIVESCIFVLLNIATLVGNSLVCLAFYRNPTLRTVTNYFVLSLALIDLSMAVLVMPVTTTFVTTRYMIANHLSCKLHYFCVTVSGGVSLWTVMLLAINRYFCVVRPALYANIFSKKRSVAMAVSVWVVTIAVVTVVYFPTGKQPRKLTVEPVAPCVQFLQSMFLSKIYGSLPIVSIAVPSVTIVVCYIKIYQTIRQHNAASAPSSQGGHSSYGVEEAKITRMLTVVVVGFYLCWLPPLINITLLSLALLGETAMNYGNFSFFVPLFASSVINPMVYGTMSQSFRKEVLKILRRQP